MKMAEAMEVDIPETDQKVIETPQCASIHRLSSSGFDSIDSGYSSLTPHSFGATPSSTTSRHRTSTGVTKRHYWLRSEHWQTDKRPRFKLNTLIDATDEDEDSSLEHSMEVLRDASIPESRYNFRMGLRDYRNRARLSSHRTTAAVTPVILSPPLVPAVPSLAACEPIDEESLVMKQSTPYPLLPSVEITFSPKTSKPSPINAITVDSQQLSRLNLTDFTSSEIKPKRLDFSQRTYESWRNRSIPDLTDREHVDILSLLGAKSNHLEVVSKIFGYLSAEDLCRVSMVSKTWKRICSNDVVANMRRVTHVCVRQNTKENLRLIKKIKVETDIQESPKSRYTRGYLVPVQNFLHVPKQKGPPRSPPVSPSKIKFHSFVKAGRSLAPTDRLYSCPKCTFASHVDSEKNVGTCTREGCQMEFCTYCLLAAHTGACKITLLATPTKQKRTIVGSKQSKRNLRRL